MTVPVSHLSPDILVVRFSAIGDILLTTPLLRALRTRHPGARVAYLTKEEYAPLLSDNPNVNEVLGIREEDTVGEVAKLIKTVRYSHLLDLHGSLRTLGLRTLARGRWSGYSKRRLERQVLITAKRDIYRDRYADGGALLRGRREARCRHRRRTARVLPVRGIRSPRRRAAGAARRRRRTGDGGTGAGRRARDQVLAHRRLGPARPATGEHGRRVVVLGGPDDVELARAVVSGVRGRLAAGDERRVVSAAGMLGLQGTGAVIKRSAALVSDDTGVMHMATGLGTPVVALFGPTVRQFGFFPYEAERSTVLELPLECRPCSAHGGPRCPLGHHRCLRAIAPESVFEALCAVLA